MNGLEQRIASALSNDTGAAELECLIADTEAAFAATTEAATLARERALDPQVIDPAARAELTDVGFTLERLEAALPQLQARHRDWNSRTSRPNTTRWRTSGSRSIRPCWTSSSNSAPGRKL
jgi:hypothetical protein